MGMKEKRKEKILALARYPRTAKNIVEVLNVTDNTVRQLISELINSGDLKVVGKTRSAFTGRRTANLYQAT